MVKFLLGGAALVVIALAALAAGWWFLVREDAQLATSAPEIPQQLRATATPDPSAGAATEQAQSMPSDTLAFRIISDRSEAAYFVNEELATVGLPSTAKGSTTAIDGTLYLTTNGAALATDMTSQFTVDLRSLQSDKSMRDQRVQQALETSRYPNATFTVSSATGYDPSIAEGQEQSLQLSGILDLHGVQREVTWDVKARREGNVISALATLTVAFEDFNITPPTFAGLVSIDHQATLQVQLIATAA